MFNFFKKKKKVIPQNGEIWILNKKGPWRYDAVCDCKIRDVKEGFVRYSLGSIFNDERMDLRTFLSIYRKADSL